MNTLNWTVWFKSWLARHPLKEPPQFLGRDYTREVLYRIKGTRVPSHAFRWFAFPRFSFTLGTVAACTLLVMVALNSSHRVETDVDETIALLEQVDPNGLSSAEENSLSDEDLLKELEQMDETGLVFS